jgi:hypothetical protein
MSQDIITISEIFSNRLEIEISLGIYLSAVISDKDCLYIQSDILNPNLHHIKSITEDPAKNRYYNYESLKRNHYS